MDLVEQLKMSARRTKMRIVLGEGPDPRMVEAAATLVKEEVCAPRMRYWLRRESRASTSAALRSSISRRAIRLMISRTRFTRCARPRG